jgi:hypothetical protein
MFTSFAESWETMLFLEKLYWCFAIPFSLLFLIQLVLTFFGGDMDAVEVDSDVDMSIEQDTGISFQFISLKNLIAFFTVFGWAGISSINAGLENWLTILISTVSGILMMAVMAAIIYFMGKLAESGTLNLSYAVGKIGTVYLTIPASRNGIGKVQVKVQGLQTLDALTDSDEDLKTGSIVEIIEIINNELLLVRKSGK